MIIFLTVVIKIGAEIMQIDNGRIFDGFEISVYTIA
jgi:hypothetical protein